MIPNAVVKDVDQMMEGLEATRSPRLLQAQAIRKLSRALPPKLQQFLLYGAIKADALVFYFFHSAVLMEFERDKEAILARMRTIYKEEGMSPSLILFRRISAKSKPRAPTKKEEQEKTPERAEGNFEIQISDEQIRKKFEQIRRHIQQGGEDAV